MRRRDLLAGLSFVPLAAPAVAQCVVPTFRRINLPGRCEPDVAAPTLDLSFMTPGSLDPRITFTRASTATYFDSAGVMQTAATNAPRWDYDPATLALRGLLLEEARTNAIFPSIPDGSVNIATNAVTTTFNAATAPSGANTAVLLADTAVNTRHDMNWVTGAVTAGTPYVASVFVKVAVQTSMQIVFNSTTFGTSAWYNFNLANGTVGTNNGPAVTSAGIVSVGNGWYRCWAAAPGTATATGAFGIGLQNNATNAGRVAPYLGTGTGIYVWGGQLEAGQFPTSHIPTTAAAVTRAVDVAAMTGANFSGWFNQSEGTFSTDTLHAATPVNGFNRALEVSDGGTANTFNATFDHASSRLTVAATVATVSTQVVAAGYPAPGVVTKFSSSYGPDVTICTNIGAGPSTPVSTTPGAIATLTQINLGNRPDGTRALFGYLRRVRYWRTALSDSDIRAVTA